MFVDEATAGLASSSVRLSVCADMDIAALALASCMAGEMAMLKVAVHLTEERILIKQQI